jgi:hypothetical protein
MALPSSGPISLGDIQTEMGFASASLSGFYDISGGLGGGGLMWHNVPNTTGGLNTYGIGIGNTASAIDIYNAYTTSNGLSTGLWYNYYQDPEIVFTINISHNGTPGIQPDVDFQIVIYNDASPPSALYTAFGGLVNPGQSISYTDYVANNTYASSSYGGYFFKVENLTAQGTTNPIFFSIIAYDSDGAGPGQNRDVYYPTTNPFDMFTPKQTFTCCDDTTLSGSLIAINKRTTIEITFS